jgi:hypothetical protein
MKLAEALILRADLQKRIEQLKQRILNNVMVQEGDEPAEDPSQLLRELEQASAELVDLVQRINRTNSSTQLDDTLSLADALAVRDSLKTRHAMYRELAQAAVIKHSRFSRSEVKFVSMVSVSNIQQTADRLAKEHRELDALIQASNWNSELT